MLTCLWPSVSYRQTAICVRLLYVNPVATTHQKPVIGKWKIEKNPSITLKKAIKPQEERREEERNRELQKQPETVNKMVIRAYLSIISLNVNGLNA